MQCYVCIEGMERPPSLRKLTSFTEPGRLAQPALPLQKIAAFASLAHNLRSEGHVRRVKFMKGTEGSGCPEVAKSVCSAEWPRGKRMPTFTRMQDSVCTFSFKSFQHGITKCSEAILNQVIALKL